MPLEDESVQTTRPPRGGFGEQNQTKKRRRMMRTSCVGLALAGLMAIASPAVAESKLVELITASKVDLKEPVDLKTVRGLKKIHRITSKEEFEKLGGKKAPVDFAKHDLVIVHTKFLCSKGTFESEVDDETVAFTAKVTERCTHRTEQLHVNTCVGYFSVSKEAVLVDRVPSEVRGKMMQMPR